MAPNETETPDPATANSGSGGPAWDNTHGGEPGADLQKRLSPEAAIALAIIVMMNSPQHRYSFLVDLEWMLFPAILAGQFKIYMSGTKPVAFAAWAKVTQEVEKRLDAGNTKLAPQEWTSGNRMRLVHLITPFGGQEKILADLSTIVFGSRGPREQSMKIHADRSSDIVQ